MPFDEQRWIFFDIDDTIHAFYEASQRAIQFHPSGRCEAAHLHPCFTEFAKLDALLP